MQAVARLIVACFLLLAGMPAVTAAPNFPPLTGRIVDQANMIYAATEATLDQQSAALEKDKGIQFVIATIPSLQGETIENYGYQLGRAWGIGRRRVDDGVILLVARDDRKVRIEVGYGLTPVLTAGLSGLIISDQILPRFRQGDFNGGIKSGADAIITQLRLPAPAAEARAKRIVAEQRSADAQSPQGFPFVFIVFMVIVLAMMMRARRHAGRLHRRGGAPIIVWGPGLGGGFGGSMSGGGFGGGFSGGGGSFGGGGASGGW